MLLNGKHIEEIAVGKHPVLFNKCLVTIGKRDLVLACKQPGTGNHFREFLQHGRSDRMGDDGIFYLCIRIDPVQSYPVFQVGILVKPVIGEFIPDIQQDDEAGCQAYG